MPRKTKAGNKGKDDSGDDNAKPNTRARAVKRKGFDSALDLYRQAKEKRQRRQARDAPSDEPPKNLCTECGVDIGDCNPRQLCGKTRCLNEDAPKSTKVADDAASDDKSVSSKSTSGSDAKSKSSSDNKSLKSASEQDDNIDHESVSEELVKNIRKNQRRRSSRLAKQEPEPSDAESLGSQDSFSEGDPNEAATRQVLGDDHSDGALDLDGAARFARDFISEMVRDGMPPEAMERAMQDAAKRAQRKVEDQEKMLDAVHDAILDDPALTEEQREEVRKLRASMKARKPNLPRIMALKCPEKKKQEILELYTQLYNVNKYTSEYNDICEEIDVKIKACENPAIANMTSEQIVQSNLPDEEKLQLLNAADNHQSEVEQLQKRVFASKLPDRIKVSLLEEIKMIKRSSGSDDKDHSSSLKWIEHCLKLPTDPVKSPLSPTASKAECAKFECDAIETFDRLCYGLKHVKERVIDYIFAKLKHEKGVMPVLALIGEPGTGKTNIAECIAAIFQRPLIRIKFGGNGDSVKLIGHARSWVGSQPGEIIRGLQEAKCRAPVFLLDEIDKVSNKNEDSSQDITSTLMHAVDTYKDNFTDSYLGFDWDLSEAIWVATMNNENIVDPILLDRMSRVYVPHYSMQDKVAICKQFFIPNFTRNMGLPVGSVRVSDAAIRFIISYVGDGSGLRAVKKTLEDMFARVSRFSSTGRVELPFDITKDWFMDQAEALGIKKRETLSYFN